MQRREVLRSVCGGMRECWILWMVRDCSCFKLFVRTVDLLSFLLYGHEELYRLPLPFESDWSDEVKWTATVTFMRRIAQSVVHFISQHQPALRCPTTEPVLNTAYLARLIRLRYPADWSCEDTSLFQCSDVPSNLVKADESCDGTCTEADKVSWHRQLEGREQDFKAVIVKLAPLLQRNQAGVCTGSNPPASCRSRMTNPVNDCAELRDQLAVLSIKLLDFIEDVFRQIIPEVCKQPFCHIILHHIILYHIFVTVPLSHLCC